MNRAMGVANAVAVFIYYHGRCIAVAIQMSAMVVVRSSYGGTVSQWSRGSCLGNQLYNVQVPCGGVWVPLAPQIDGWKKS